MNNFRTFTIIAIWLFFSCCDNQKTDSILLSQKKSIDTYLSGDGILEYKYFDNNGIMKEVKKLDALGSSTILQFNVNGGLQHKYFLDKYGNKAGDEIHFNTNEEFNDYFFWRDPETLLFTGVFNNEKIFATEGKPWLISGQSNIEPGDTVLFYIAAPLIPNFRTRIRFGKTNGDLETEYFNDIRQMDYKTIIHEIGLHEFTLKVDIINTDDKVVFTDSTSIELHCYSREPITIK